LLVLLISFAALPLRGFLAGTFIEHWGVWPVQALDGIGAGLQSVAVPVMTVQGVGASLSPAIGGWLAQELGYNIAFYVLGSFAIVSVALWVGFAGTMRPACSGSRTQQKEQTA
jgi:predicted permease